MLAATSAVAEVGAFSLAGWLVQILTAPITILIDAISFLVSALSIALIQEPEPAVEIRRARAGVRREIVEGGRAVMRDPILRALAIAAAISSFSSALFGTQYSLYALDVLGFKPGVLGVIYGVGGVSSLLGALVARRIVNRIGVGRAMVLGMAMFGVGELMLPIAHGATVTAAALMVVQQLSDGWFVIYEINHTSLKQAIAPAAILGRVNASFRFVIIACALAGTVVSGIAGEAFGLRPTIAAGALGTLVAALWLLRSPVLGVGTDITASASPKGSTG